MLFGAASVSCRFADASTLSTFDVLAGTGPYSVFYGTLSVVGNAFSVGASTLAVGGGKIGLGTASPGSKLHVLDGDIRLSTSPGASSRGVVFQDGTTQYSAGSARFGESILFASQYSDCATAIAGIGSAGATLVVDKTCDMASSIVTPPTLSLEFLGAGQFSIAAASTITIQGPISAQSRRIFSGAGNVILSSAAANEVRPQWFGAAANCAGRIDDSAAIQSAITAVSAAGNTRGVVRFSPGCYYTASTVTVSSAAYITIEGSGRFNTYIFNVGGSSGALLVDGGPSSAPAISNYGATTIRDIALGSNTGPALYFYRSNNHIVNRVFLFSAGTTSYYLRINGGSQGQYDDLIIDWGNTPVFPALTGYFGTLTYTSGISDISIVSLDSAPIDTSEHSFSNIRTGAGITGHAVDIVNLSTTIPMRDISFTNAYVKSVISSAGWHIDGADVSISNSNVEAASGTVEAVYVQASSQVSNVFISNLHTSGMARLRLKYSVGGTLYVSNSNFSQLYNEIPPTRAYASNVHFTSTPTGSGSIYPSGYSDWVNVGGLTSDGGNRSVVSNGGIEIRAGGASVYPILISTSTTSNVAGLMVDSNNRVGIGTVSPASKLHVSGFGTTDMSVSNSSAATSLRWNLRAGQTTDEDFAITQVTGGGENPRLLIDANGKVGIGTASPASKLHVSGLSTTDISLSDTLAATSLRWNLRAGQVTDEDFAITQVTGGGGNPRLLIDANGKVGINTTTPSQNLEIGGGVLASSFTASAIGNIAYSLTTSSGIRMNGGCINFRDGSMQCATASSDLVHVASITINATTTSTSFGLCQATVTLQTRNHPVVVGFAGTAEGSNSANDLGWACLVNGAFCPGANTAQGIVVQGNINNAFPYNLSGSFVLDSQGVDTLNICISFACGSGVCQTTIPGTGGAFTSSAKFFAYELPR